jgi:hypothetical protein
MKYRADSARRKSPDSFLRNRDHALDFCIYLDIAHFLSVLLTTIVNMFHDGDLQSGIALAVHSQKAVLCFVRGMNSTSDRVLYTDFSEMTQRQVLPGKMSSLTTRSLRASRRRRSPSS